MGHLLRIAGVAVSLLILPGARADRASNWRMFKAADGLHESYTTWVSTSPRGNIWVRHDDPAEISVYDGYQIRTMRGPGKDKFRIYESRTGQLWTLSASGLVVHTSGQWAEHPVAEIRARLGSDPARQRREIPLLPAEWDRVLFLLPDKLMEYDAAARRTVQLAGVADTGLGHFNEMAEARDGGLWVTGQKGLIKFSGSLRHLRPGAAFQKFLIDPALGAEDLQRPFESSPGTVTAAAVDVFSKNRRLAVHFDGQNWSVRRSDTANIRQAWTAWDRVHWAFTVNSLLRFEPGAHGGTARERLWAGQYNDVAAEPGAAFWLSTSEGLLRYAPPLWRIPVGLEDLSSHVHALLRDKDNRLWVAGSESLLCFTGTGVRPIRWPESLEGTFDTRDPLFELPDGRLAIASSARSWLFDPESEQFEILSHPSGHRLRLLGQFQDGSLAVYLYRASGVETPAFELERFDGVTFRPLVQAPADWSFGPDLFFAAPLANGDLWLGATGGLARFRNGSFEIFGQAEGFRETRALCFADLGGGKLWCSGPGKIFEFTGKSWTEIGSGFDRISGITKGEGDKVWVATAAGLYCYSGGFWMLHGVEEGLPSMGISEVLAGPLGELWAGTTRGLSRYHPDADLAPPKTLPPVVEAGPGYETGAQTTILLNGVDKWRDTSGERLLFSTRLDEQQWTPFTNTMAITFDRLGAGKHRLDVRAMDRNWNQDPAFARFDFSVVLPWYRDPRLTAAVLSGAVLVTLFAALAVNRHLRLIRSYAEVERIVNLRTRQLARANEELLQSQKMTALGTLAASIAHDFNNILSIIKGSAQIIQNNLDDKQKVLTRLNRIQAVVEQGSGIVKSILGVSRVKEQDLVQADLNTIVEGGLKLLGDRFLPEVTIQFAPAEGLPPVRVVPELIHQMLINLILNAADAMEHRGTILVSTDHLFQLPPDLALSPARAPNHVYVAVEDSGTGIDPAILPRLFEPFFTTKALSVQRGTGLGLSIVYQVASELGYGLEVRSRPGKGSTFRIILPAVAEP